MPRTRGVLLALAAVLLFSTGLALARVGRYRHCTTEEVSLTAADGVRLAAELYIPRDLAGLVLTTGLAPRALPRSSPSLGWLPFLAAPAAASLLDDLPPPPLSAPRLARTRLRQGSGFPAVVFTHGLLASHEIYETAYSLEFARRGIAVLAIDYRGHGNSSGRMEDIPVIGIEQPRWRGVRSQPDLLAAYEYLLRRPEIDPSRIALAGHSLGGFASTDAAIVLRDRVWATVAIGAAPLYAGPDYPLNFYVLNGALDELFGPRAGREAIAKATDGALKEEGITVGRFESGTARRLDLVPWVNHAAEAVSPRTAALAIRWIESAFFGGPRSPIESEARPRLAGVGLVVAGIVLGFVPFLAAVERICLGPTPRFLFPAGLGRTARRRRAAGLTIFYLVGWSAGAPTGFLILWLHPFRGLPILLANPILAMMYGGAVNLALMGLVVRAIAGSRPVAGDGGSIRPGTAGAGAPAGAVPAQAPAWRRAAYGVVPFLFLFGASNLGLGGHFADLWPGPGKWPQMAILACLLAPPLAVNEAWLRRWILPLAATHTAGLAVPAGMAACFVLSLHLSAPPRLGLYSIAAAVFAGIMLLAAAYARPSRRRRELLGPWLFHLLAASWLLAVLLPPR